MNPSTYSRKHNASFSMDRISIYSMLPRVYRRITSAPGSRAVYLTFDDGPDPEVTPRVLDLLERYQARGTFFLVGERASRYRDVVKQILTRGHAVGNHSFSHGGFERLSLGRQLDEVQRTEDLLAELESSAGPHPFRPPHGRASARLLLALARRGYDTVFWSFDSRDYAHDAARSIALLNSHLPVDGDIVLMHDDHRTVLSVLNDMLPRWAADNVTHPVIGGASGANRGGGVRRGSQRVSAQPDVR
jgi:peptidoglycan-N-acetylglucosamine deacetylase